MEIILRNGTNLHIPLYLKASSRRLRNLTSASALYIGAVCRKDKMTEDPARDALVAQSEPTGSQARLVGDSPNQLPRSNHPNHLVPGLYRPRFETISRDISIYSTLSPETPLKGSSFTRFRRHFFPCRIQTHAPRNSPNNRNRNQFSQTQYPY